jgi:hypothetical protein
MWRFWDRCEDFTGLRTQALANRYFRTKLRLPHLALVKVASMGNQFEQGDGPI